MMNDTGVFSAYRMSLSLPDQISLFRGDRSKTDLINEVIRNLQEVVKQTFSSGNKKHLFYFVRRIVDEIYLFQIGREDRLLQPQEGDKSFVNSELVVTPNVYFIIDVKTQIVLIQERKSVFEKSTTPANRIAEFFEEWLSNRFGIVDVRLEPIAKAEEIWVEIEEAQEIYSLSLDISPPNFFGMRFQSNIDIKEAHEETQFEKFVITLKNKFGRLKIERKDFQDIFQTLASGAGDFVLQMKNKFGKVIRLTNASRITGISLPTNTDNIDPDKLKNDLENLDTLNDNSPEKKDSKNEKDDKQEIKIPVKKPRAQLRKRK